MIHKHNKKNGYIALSAIVLITAFVITITTTVGITGIGDSQSSLALLQGTNMLNFVEGCTEDALIKSRYDVNYTGGNITRPEGTCTVTVSKVGTTWTLTVSTTDTTYRRQIQVVIVRNPTGITLTSWNEI